jgi:hypothetical protein
VEKVVICTFTSEHHEFQRKNGKTYFLAASAILFVWVTNGVILPLGDSFPNKRVFTLKGWKLRLNGITALLFRYIWELLKK